MNQKERMISGALYNSNVTELVNDRKHARKLLRAFNASTEEEAKLRKSILKDLLGDVHENYHIEPPFRCDYGYNIQIGEDFYANFDCIFLDVCKIVIGNNVMFGPRVCLYTATHPLDPKVRNTGIELGTKIEIGSNVWIGGNTVVNPGVTIGDNVIVGSGSVVTKDIPDNAIAVGNPCKVLRFLTESDTEYWNEKYQLYVQEAKSCEYI